jgi:tetratricopeptide (TPR) repeat protein
LITELARISSIRVISRTSAMRYKGSRKPLAQIARELDVDAIVEGELLRSNDRVRLTIQLIEAANDRHIWAETYDRNLDDVLALQASISRSIAEAIRIRLSPAELAHISPQRKVDPAAHEAYLKARFFAEKRTSSGMKKAVEFFEEALRRDPQYAESYAGLAKTYQLLGAFEVLSPEETHAKVRVAADRALSLDPTLSEAYTARGLSASMYERDWEAAERDFQNAFRVNSNDALAHHWYGEHLANIGQVDRAVLELQRARELDPLSLIINSILGRMYRDAGRYQESIDQCRKTLELDGEYPLAHLYLGMSYAAMGHYPLAIAEMERANKVDDGPAYASVLGYAYAASGESRKARAVIRALIHRAGNAYLPSSHIAMIYVGLGEKETAFAWLQRGYAERDPQLPFLLFDPFMNSLRPDPRFQKILSNFRLPP